MTASTPPPARADQCPRCAGRLLHDAVGESYCLPCGWRALPGDALGADTAAEELQLRTPTHAGYRL